MKAKRHMHQPSKAKSSGRGRNIVISRLRPTVGKMFKISSGQRRYYSIFASLLKPDGSLTTDMEVIVTLMLEHFTSEDNVQDDSEFPSKSEPNLKEQERQQPKIILYQSSQRW